MFIITVIAAGNALAVYFTIQLKNGNELKTVKYWDEEGKITFYTGAGTVSIPRIDVQNPMPLASRVIEKAPFSGFHHGLSMPEHQARVRLRG